MFKNVRKYPRYPFSTKAVIKRKEAGAVSQTTQVVTISQGGIGIYTNALMKTDTRVCVDIIFSGDGVNTESLDGRIASVCPQEKDYFVGIAFDKEISYDHFIDILI